MLALAALLVFTSSPGAPAPTAHAAVQAALAAPGARAEVLAVRGATPRGCAPAAWEVLRPVAGSGRVALRFDGREAAGASCEGWAWADVRVVTPGWRAARDLRVGEALAGAVEPGDVPLATGRRPAATLPPGAAAARPLRAGDVVAEGDLRVGPAPGDPVTVAVRAGDLELTVTGRAVACARGRGGLDGGCAAALLPGGRRVEGRWDGARIAVEAP